MGRYHTRRAARPQAPARLAAAYRDSASLVLTMEGLQAEKGSVSHLLHMTFVLGLCGSLCYPCFVKPAPCCESACSPSYRTLVLFLADM